MFQGSDVQAGSNIQEAPRGESEIFVGVQKKLLLQQSLIGWHPTQKPGEESHTYPRGQSLHLNSWGLFLYFSDILVLVSLI